MVVKSVKILWWLWGVTLDLVWITEGTEDAEDAESQADAVFFVWSRIYRIRTGFSGLDTFPNDVRCGLKSRYLNPPIRNTQKNTPSKNTPLSGGIRNASGLKTPPTRDAERDRKAQMCQHQRMKNMWVWRFEFSDAYTQLPVGRRREVTGLPRQSVSYVHS